MQAVQAETPRKESTLGNKQEKTPTEQQAVPEPETVVATPEPVKVQEPAPQPLTDHEQLMQAAGIQQSDWYAVEYIINHESSWRPTIYNNEGCVGLGQRCPASTLLNDCPDLDAVCQLRHFSNYAVSRYGGWQQAYNVWASQSWW